MPILVDTNILVRFFDRGSMDHLSCVEALRRATVRRGEFVICTQVEIEFWSVATRPLNANGLGMTPADADASLRDFEAFLSLLPEPANIASMWRQLVVKYEVRGRTSHDARLVGLMDAHGVRDLLSINASDFARYSHIRVVSPQQVASGLI